MKELLERFENKSPEIVFHWNDPETEAEGWTVINSLRGGAAGGGTRMREGLDMNEVLSLAKTMEVKFTVSGPPIGGAKSGINFNPDDPATARPELQFGGTPLALRHDGSLFVDQGRFAMGSNVWASGSRKSANGAPILANDPHIDARNLPGIWHPMGLVTPEWRAVGGRRTRMRPPPRSSRGPGSRGPTGGRDGGPRPP